MAGLLCWELERIAGNLIRLVGRAVGEGGRE